MRVDWKMALRSAGKNSFSRWLNVDHSWPKPTATSGSIFCVTSFIGHLGADAQNDRVYLIKKGSVKRREAPQPVGGHYDPGVRPRVARPNGQLSL
jgi:hypothetical protein